MRYFKTSIYITALAAMMVACSDNDEGVTPVESHFTLKVKMPETDYETRVGVTQQEGSLDLIPFWVNGDKMDFYAVRENEIIPHDGEAVQDRKEIVYLGNYEATNIVTDGSHSSCEFRIDYPDEFDRWEPYQIIGVSGKLSGIVDQKIVVDASLMRTTLFALKAPVWLSVDMSDYVPEVTCKHIGAYEVLHITNTSNKDISFRLLDYSAEKKWYYDDGSFYPENWGYINKKIVPYTLYDVEPIVRVGAGEKASLVSWYITSTDKFDKVTMMAEIDGQTVRSANTKSSQLRFSNGYAYHLGVTWDGDRLTFDNGDIVTVGMGVVIDNIGGEMM